MANYYAVCVKPSCLWTEETLIDKRIDAHFYSIKYMQYYNKLMKCKIKKMSLYNICSRMNSGPFGSALLASQYVDKGVAFIRPLNCKDYIVDIDNDVVFISKEDSERLKSSKFSSGDLIFTKIGNGIGDVAIIPQKIFECNISGNLMGVKVKNNIDNYYVLTFLKSIYGQNQIWQGMMNSAKPKIDMDTLKSIVIPIPSPEIQKYIGDKVRKAEELREEAKRLKKEAEEIINESLNIKQLDFLWEGSKVKFEWTSTEILTDRIDANYYEQKYVETINHIKKFSKKYITLNSIIDSIYTGKKPIYYEKGIEAYFVQSGNISSNFLELDNKEKVDLSKYNQILFGDLLIAKDGETIGKIAINLTNETIIINEHTYCVRLKDEYKCYSAYIYYFLTNKYINPLIRREATGSAQKGLNFTFTENIIIPILEEDKIMNLYNLEVRRCNNIYKSKQLIQEAKQDVEDLIEGNFDMSKVRANS